MASVDAHLGEITRIADEELDEASGREPESEFYRDALEAMRELGGEAATDSLAEKMKESIRQSETLPQEQSVRSHGLDVLDDRGVEIPEGSWFAR